MKTYTKQEWFDVVARTAGHGLVEQRKDKQQFHKWLAVWGMGLVGEAKEAIEAFHCFGSDSQEFHDEAGDLFWYIAANSMLLGLPHLDWITEVPSIKYSSQLELLFSGERLHKALFVAIDRLELVKKIVRDDRVIDFQNLDLEDNLLGSLNVIYSYFVSCCDFHRAIAAVEAKLLKRYPDGYSAEASINRTV